MDNELNNNDFHYLIKIYLNVTNKKHKKDFYVPCREDK